MNETFPAAPISVEVFAGRLIALDTLRHAIVEMWDFWDRERHGDGFTAADVLRLEEIRQIVNAERPLLPVSRETALQYKEILRSRGVFHALPPSDTPGFRTSYPAVLPPTATSIFAPLAAVQISPREKSNDEHSTSTLVSTPDPVPPSTPVATFDGARYQEYRARQSAAATPDNAKIPARRSADAPRKAAAKVRSRGAKRRRGQRKNGKTRRRDPKH